MTLADQVLSGASNVLAVILVARALDADDFGRFALAYAVLTVVLSLVRAHFGTRISLAEGAESAHVQAASTFAALAMAAPVVAVVVLLLSIAASGGGSLSIFLIVAVTTPLVCMQDVLRFGAAASGRPWAALASDAAWLLVIAAPFVLQRQPGPVDALLLWAGGGVLAAVIGVLLTSTRPRWRDGLQELRRRDQVGESVTVGTLLATASSLLLLLVVARSIGAVAAGSLRGASAAMAPINVLLAFTTLSLTPSLARRARSKDVVFCSRVAVALSLCMTAWGALLLALPPVAGRAAFGASWTGIREVLPWTCLEYLLLCFSATAILGLKVRRQARALLVQRLAASLVTLVGGTAVALAAADPRPVAALLVVSALVSALVGWVQLFRRRSSAVVAAARPPSPVVPCQ